MRAVRAHFSYLHMAQVDLPIQQAHNLYIVYIKYCISIEPVSINGAINVSHNTLQAKVMHVIASHHIASHHITTPYIEFVNHLLYLRYDHSRKKTIKYLQSIPRMNVNFLSLML